MRSFILNFIFMSINSSVHQSFMQKRCSWVQDTEEVLQYLFCKLTFLSCSYLHNFVNNFFLLSDWIALERSNVYELVYLSWWDDGNPTLCAKLWLRRKNANHLKHNGRRRLGLEKLEHRHTGSSQGWWREFFGIPSLHLWPCMDLLCRCKINFPTFTVAISTQIQ